MIIYFADRKMNILGQASTNLPNGILVREDLKEEEIDTGVAIFSCYLPCTKESRMTIEGYAAVGNYILRKHLDKTEFYTIIDMEYDTKSEEVYLYSEDAGLDLLNEIVGSYEADKAYPASYYIKKFSYDSGFEIGLNEISNLSRQLKWEGTQTATERIASIATQFDNAEIAYSFDVKGLSITHKYINIYKARGKRVDVELRMNREIDRIITKKSIASLATALVVTGGTPEGQEDPITLKGYKYDDGDFYVADGNICSRKALAKWSRYQWETGDNVGHIVNTYTYDTTSQSELFNRSLSALKKCCDMEVNYEVDIAKLPDNAQIGDYINIVDSDGKLYLSARILKLEVSDANDTQKATLGNYLIKGSGVSERLEALAEQFKNIAASRTLYTWIAYAEDEYGKGITLEPAGMKYMGTAVNKLSSIPELSDTTIYTWALIQGGQGKPGEPGTSVTIISTHIAYQTGSNGVSVPTGTWVDAPPATEPGKYLWTRTEVEYSDGTNTVSYSVSYHGIDGENGSSVTIIAQDISYQVSDGGTVIPNGTWISEIPDVPGGKFLWTRTIVRYSDGNSTVSYSVSRNGTDGDNGVGIKDIANKYAVSSSSTKEPTAWVDAVPSVTDSNRYLWNYEITTYTDNTTQQTAKRIIGVYGDTGSAGRGIDTITEYYLATSAQSGVTIATIGWTTTVQSTTATNKYLWNYEVVNYTDDTNYTSAPVIIGTHGTQGSNGKDAAIMSDTEPSDKTYMWCDTSTDPPILKQWNGIDWSVVNDQTQEIQKIYLDIYAAIEENADSIMIRVGEEMYKKDDVDQLIGGINTLFEQTSKQFEFKFNQFVEDLGAVTSDTENRFSEINKYIRFVDGSIIIGIEGNPLTLKMQNDRISFLENGVEVAYISNRRMYITDVEVTSSLTIGNFAFIPRNNGNLSFKKVR